MDESKRPYSIPIVYTEMSYAEAAAYVSSLPLWAGRPGSEICDLMMARLNRPERRFPSVQIAGTNGKGSTARYTSSILQEHGQKTGLLISPHLISYNERILVGNVEVSQEVFAKAVSVARAAAITAEVEPCEFAILTCAAFVIFAIEEIDIAVLEVGLGGRFDPTSVVDPCATCITSIGLDHVAVLGDNVVDIAKEKSAIIFPGQSVVFGTGALTPPEVLKVLRDRASLCGIQPFEVREDLGFTVLEEPTELTDPIQFEFKGRFAKYNGLEVFGSFFSVENASAAIALVEGMYGRRLSEQKIRTALRTTQNPGRFQVLSKDPIVIVDVCHNEESAHTFVDAVKRIGIPLKERPPLLLAMLRDKDFNEVVSILAPEFPEIHVTQVNSSRSLSACDLAKVVEHQTGYTPMTYKSTQDALAHLRKSGFIACGSVVLVGEVIDNW